MVIQEIVSWIATLTGFCVILILWGSHIGYSEGLTDGRKSACASGVYVYTVPMKGTLE